MDARHKEQLINHAKDMHDRASRMGFRHDKDTAERARIRLELLGEEREMPEDYIIRHVTGINRVEDTRW